MKPEKVTFKFPTNELEIFSTMDLLWNAKGLPVPSTNIQVWLGRSQNLLLLAESVEF